MTTLAQSEVVRIEIEINQTLENIARQRTRLENPSLSPLQRSAAERSIQTLETRTLPRLRQELADAQALSLIHI